MLEIMWDAAALLSAHGPHLIEMRAPVPEDVQHRYWSLSQARVRHWRTILKQWRDSEPSSESWRTLQRTLHAVFTGEVLSRLMATLMDASDLKRGVRNAGPIGRSVFVAHLEIRQSALQLLVDGPQISGEQLARLDTLRRRAERWADVLIGHLVVRYGVTDYCFDLSRARDFGSEQLRTVTNATAHQQLWDLYRLSLRSAFEPYSLAMPRDEEFREALVSTICGWLPPDLFTESGLIKSPWVARFLRTVHATDAQDPQASREC
jgi:hypothetical protein